MYNIRRMYMKKVDKQSLPSTLLTLGVFLFSISNFNTGHLIEKTTSLLGFLLGSIGAIWMALNYKKTKNTTMFIITLLLGIGTAAMFCYFLIKLF